MPCGDRVLTTLESIGVPVIRELVQTLFEPNPICPVNLTSSGNEFCKFTTHYLEHFLFVPNLAEFQNVKKSENMYVYL